MKQVEVEHSNLRDRLEGIVPGRSEVGEWRVVGQEQDGALLLCWMSAETFYSEIGVFDSDNDSYMVLYKFDSVKNIIQASVNLNRTLIVFSVYEKENEDEESENKDKECRLFSLFLARVKGVSVVEIHAKKKNQTMAQFLYWRKKSPDKFLVMAHQEAIQIFQVEDNDETEAADLKVTAVETIVKAFAWGQWDAIHQSLYFIHYRKPMHRVEGETQPDETELAPTLSALQFHEDMPHETVLNIPLNLPGMEGTGNETDQAICRTYENDAVPLRVHDCSLDVTVVSDSKGILCICHHYLYQPVKPPTTEVMDESNTVHFAYSVTLLHHGHVIHCNIPGIPFSQATTLRPTFTMYNDQHLIVYCPEVFIHMLDIGQKHEPCCHILIGNHSLSSNPEVSSRLVALLNPPISNADYNSHTDELLLNLSTLDVVKLKVTNQHLIDAYNSPDAILENKLSILHYFLIHVSEPEIVAELLTPIAEHSMDLDITNIMQEVLVGGAFATVMRSLPSDAIALINLLPFTTVNASTPIQVKVGSKHTMSLTQEDLWNPSVMLLSPRQRLMPYRPDMWTALWDALSAPKEPRFRSATVAEKLMVSLVCYQPEALSRCSTPLSPGGALIGSGGTLSDMAMITGGGGGRSKQGTDPLPFYEVESSAASKQEHVISVNLREVSMHLLKRMSGSGGGSGSRGGFDGPMQVHAVATRYAAAQLESSHLVCHLLTRSAAIDTLHQERGFPLVNSLEDGKRLILFSLMERYNLAIELLAFPLPQGFPSFMAYLGYRTLPFTVFLQYVQASVLQLQVDVMKAIIADLSDSGEGLMRKLRLLQLLPRSRAKRLLNQWAHPASLMIRAREHTLNILSGVEGAHNRGHPHSHHNRIRNLAINRGLAAFPSADRLSPLDTFLDLLTAKASLAELDFTLLVEATMASTEEFLE